MDPVFLVILAGIWLAQNFSVETKHAARGTVSPRWQRKLAKLEREGRPGYVPRYGSRDWVADLWGDFLQARTDARRAAAAEPKEKVGFVERMRRAWRATQPPTETPAHQSERSTPRAVPVLDIDAELDRPTDEPTPGITEVPCVNCGDPCKVTDYQVDGGSVWCADCLDQYPERGTDPRPALNPDAADARVIPIFRKADKEEKENMTVADTGAEAGTFLVTAIAHCREVAAAHESHSDAGGEEFINGLVDAGVGPTYIDLIVEAQQHSAESGALWAAAAKAMEEDGGDVGESYERHPDVGDKEHVTGGH